MQATGRIQPFLFTTIRLKSVSGPVPDRVGSFERLAVCCCAFAGRQSMAPHQTLRSTSPSEEPYSWTLAHLSRRRFAKTQIEHATRGGATTYCLRSTSCVPSQATQTASWAPHQIPPCALGGRYLATSAPTPLSRVHTLTVIPILLPLSHSPCTSAALCSASCPIRQGDREVLCVSCCANGMPLRRHTGSVVRSSHLESQPGRLITQPF